MFLQSIYKYLQLLAWMVVGMYLGIVVFHLSRQEDDGVVGWWCISGIYIMCSCLLSLSFLPADPTI